MRTYFSHKIRKISIYIVFPVHGPLDFHPKFTAAGKGEGWAGGAPSPRRGG